LIRGNNDEVGIDEEWEKLNLIEWVSRLDVGDVGFSHGHAL
jgi:metallophosphoesterase superfamily enzyme